MSVISIDQATEVKKLLLALKLKIRCRLCKHQCPFGLRVTNAALS